MLPQTCRLWSSLYEPPAHSPTSVEPYHYETSAPNNQVELANTNLSLVFSHKISDSMDPSPAITMHSTSITNLPLIIHASISQTKTITTQHTNSHTNAHYHCIVTWRSLSATRRNFSVDYLLVPPMLLGAEPLPSLSPNGSNVSSDAMPHKASLCLTITQRSPPCRPGIILVTRFYWFLVP